MPTHMWVALSGFSGRQKKKKTMKLGWDDHGRTYISSYFIIYLYEMIKKKEIKSL